MISFGLRMQSYIYSSLSPLFPGTDIPLTTEIRTERILKRKYSVFLRRRAVQRHSSSSCSFIAVEMPWNGGFQPPPRVGIW